MKYSLLNHNENIIVIYKEKKKSFSSLPEAKVFADNILRQNNVHYKIVDKVTGSLLLEWIPLRSKNN